MRPLCIVEGEVTRQRRPCFTNIVVRPQIGELRGTSQPRALSEPDVNLSIHPAPIIRPLVPGSSGQTWPGCDSGGSDDEGSGCGCDEIAQESVFWPYLQVRPFDHGEEIGDGGITFDVGFRRGAV